MMHTQQQQETQQTQATTQGQETSASDQSEGIQDNRAVAVMQRKMQVLADGVGEQSQLPVQPQEQEAETPAAKPNNTGLPDHLKSGIENLSGYSMDDVKVHYNSSKPAQLQAHAYAQGTDIHIGPGQEKHLPHEAWHVVQQKQGRVKPTLQLKSGESVNDDVGLEREADFQGNYVMKSSGDAKIDSHNLKSSPLQKSIVQRQLKPIISIKGLELIREGTASPKSLGYGDQINRYNNGKTKDGKWKKGRRVPGDAERHYKPVMDTKNNVLSQGLFAEYSTSKVVKDAKDLLGKFNRDLDSVFKIKKPDSTFPGDSEQNSRIGSNKDNINTELLFSKNSTVQKGIVNSYDEGLRAADFSDAHVKHQIGASERDYYDKKTQNHLDKGGIFTPLVSEDEDHDRNLTNQMQLEFESTNTILKDDPRRRFTPTLNAKIYMDPDEFKKKSTAKEKEKYKKKYFNSKISKFKHLKDNRKKLASGIMEANKLLKFGTTLHAKEEDLKKELEDHFTANTRQNKLYEELDQNQRLTFEKKFRKYVEKKTGAASKKKISKKKVAKPPIITKNKKGTLVIR